MEKHIDKPKDAKSDSSQPTIDALSLLKEHHQTVKSASYAAKPADLDLNPAEISRVDPKKPTALFLDTFKDAQPVHINSLIGGKPARTDFPVGHGEVSAKAAEQNGFNVIRVDDQAQLAGSLAGIEKDVANGKLPLGKGDVINISFGQEHALGSMSYDWASKMFGMNINKDNVGDLKVQKEIRQKMEALAKKPGNNEDASLARNALSILDSVDRLQKKGIQIMHAQPNHKDTFDAEFLNGQMELSANGTDGKPADFSAENTLAKPNLGVFEVQYPSYGILRPIKVADLSLRPPHDGSFSIKAGDKVYNYGPSPDQIELETGPVKIDHNGEVSKPQPDYASLMANPSYKPQSFAGQASRTGTGGAYKFEPGSALPPLEIVQTKPAATDHLTDATFGSIRGTSFVNIVTLEEEKAKLTAEKLQSPPSPLSSPR